MVFPTFFNLILNLSIRCSWCEPLSAPSLVFVGCIELLHFWLKDYNQSDFSIDHQVMSTCRVFSCVVGRGCLLWPMNSLGKSLLAFALLHSVPKVQNLPVTPGISWLPTFAFQSPVMEGHLVWVLVLEDLVGLHRTVQLQLLQHYWLGHRLGLLWYWMACLGNKEKSFCHFWDYTQVLHFGLFCWLWWLLHFF